MSSAAQSRRVVVVGGTGNIGTSVLEALSAAPEVAGITALSRRAPEDLPAKVTWHGVDLCGDDLVPHFEAADAVINLAWIFQPTRDPIATWRNNVLGALRVFDAVAAAGVPALLHASSVAAYSPGPERPVDERWPTHGWPGAAYSREKAYLERVLDSYSREHPEIRVVRMRNAFCFKPESASQQRRLFLGPLVPEQLVRPEALPVLPALPGLRFQAVHSDDVGDAYRRAVLHEVSGAFNIAADPVIDNEVLGEVFGAQRVRTPRVLARTALAAAWQLRLVPASPELFDTFMRLPLMDTSRARSELGWEPEHSSIDAVRGFLAGLRATEGAPTPPLAPELPGGRAEELATGVGRRQ
ncbi:NAD-dependent epimerase/dehydratase family protein [Saccharopolyspora cebuensis]|uniref:NAD-dependent epimerase/dehydratase family protein n=1 Tax=Saccharopolyspora cebuensis TaxID=418759 RepID=A0ABV4CUU3_9PSEU